MCIANQCFRYIQNIKILLVLLHEEVCPVADVEVGEDDAQTGEGGEKRAQVVAVVAAAAVAEAEAAADGVGLVVVEMGGAAVGGQQVEQVPERFWSVFRFISLFFFILHTICH